MIYSEISSMNLFIHFNNIEVVAISWLVGFDIILESFRQKGKQYIQ